MHHLPTFVRAQEPRPFAERRRRLCFVGRVQPIKGLDTLLDALEIVQASGVVGDLETVIAGDTGTPAGEALRARLAARPVPGVTLAGQLDEAAILELLQSSMLSVVPSLWYENTPNALLESLACGTPAIASDLGSLQEMLAGTGAGLLFPPGDAVALAATLETAFTEADLGAMGRRAHALARERYSPGGPPPGPARPLRRRPRRSLKHASAVAKRPRGSRLGRIRPWSFELGRRRLPALPWSLTTRGSLVSIGRHLRITLLILAIFLALAGAAVAAQRADLALTGDSVPRPAEASRPAQAPPIRPQVGVTKTADPTTVPETGGDVTYTVTITNAGVEAFTLDAITDDVGNAGPVALTDLDPTPPASLDPGGSYTGTFTRHVAGDAPAGLTDVVEVTVSDGDGDSDSASADATVTFSDVLPQISVTKTADPTTVPESGDVVAFTVSVVNLSGEPVTLMSLTDTAFSLDALLPGWVGTVLAPYDGVDGGSDTLEGTFVQWVEGNASGPDHVDTVTAEAWDDEGNPAGAGDDATVGFTDVLPQISVTKTADPTTVPEKGDDVTYTVTITNDGAEAVTLGAITDKVGDADPAALTDLDPVPPASLDPGAVYTGTFTRRVAGEFPGSLTDVVEVAAGDDDGNPTSAGDDATVTFTETAPAVPAAARRRQ